MPDDARPDVVLYERPALHIAVVTLNRPEKRNAINAAMTAGIEAAIRASEADSNVRVVLLASSLPSVFCAGADLDAVAAGREAGIQTWPGGFAGLAYAHRTRPWIAVVEGAALAGGCEIALACDMIVASDTARFGLPEVQRGLMAAAGGVHRIAARLPWAVANELLATGEPIDGARARHFGLVNRLTPPGGALAEARELADRIAANAPIAVQYSLMSARMSAGQPDTVGREVVAERFRALRETDDYREGLRAFVEKRTPVWSGR